VLGSQLQIAECADETTAALTASLERLVRMKKTGCLIRKRHRCIDILKSDRPEADL